MNRRQFLSLTALSVSLSGCLEGTPGAAAERGTPPSNATTSKTPGNTTTVPETPSPDGATPECWPSMCDGTPLVEVVVAQGFSGSVVLQAECRGAELPVQPGESIQLDREADAETCEISVDIDGEPVFSEHIEGYESLTLSVSSDGGVETEWVVT